MLRMIPLAVPSAEENAGHVLERGAISGAWHDKSLHYLVEKMGTQEN